MPTWIPAIALLWAVVSTAVAYAFASGKFAGVAVTREQLQAALDDKADCDRVTELGRRMQGEHAERKRQVEDLNAIVGQLRIEQRGQHEVIDGLRDDVRELRRKVFNGGMAGV